MGRCRKSALPVLFLITSMFDCPTENNSKLILRRLLYESQQTLVYRALRGAEEPPQPIILKLLKSDYPTPEQLRRYQHEYEITQNLMSPGVIQIYGLHPYRNTVFLTLEDIGGQSLAQSLPGHPWGLEAFFDLAIAITTALADIHSAGLIHKDLNPSNIIHNPETGQLKIIDFGLAARQGVAAATAASGSLEGTLAYISPEQTGRLNCPLDHRTDLYALGVTFYQLLTNQLPFPSRDLLEVIHCHLARTPAPPHTLDQRIPEALSQVVMKLLAKPVTERYQTAKGLEWDLDRCRQAWRGCQHPLTLATDAADAADANGAMEASAFPLGEQDYGAQFQLPAQLYGRDREREKLLSLWRGVVQQDLPMALVMVAGGAGVGKTALIQGLYPAITQAQGYFLTGKCDQLQATRPYDVISQALNQWVRHLLSEPDHLLAQWRSRLQTGLSNPGVLVEILPDLALILGPQPPVVPLGMVEAQHRFHRVMGQFLRLLCRPENPIALFLDDLQWADTATLKLLQVLRQDAQMASLLVIGAYRDGELSPHHPLRELLTLQTGQRRAVEIPLQPLNGGAIAQFLTTTFRQSHDPVEPLAHLIQEKTGGNPFFTREFLQACVRDGVIAWDGGQWRWELEAIAAQPSTANVVELMIAMIQQFPPATQRALRYGACFGRHVDVELLAQLLEQPCPITQNALTPAIDHALLPNTPGQQYTFRHDRIQQAAYELLAPHERIKAHYKIALLLLKPHNPRSCPRNIFTIADHCNFGYPIVVTSMIRQQGAELNLQAAQRAQAASAYGAALSYCQAGIALLAPNCWSSQYRLTLNLYTHGADNAYSLGEYAVMEAYLQTIRLHTRAVLDQVKAYDIEIRAQMAKGDPQGAVNTLLHILRRLDLHYSARPHALQLAWATALTLLQLWRQSPLKLTPARPQPPQRLAALSLITTTLPALAATNPRLYRLLILRQVQAAVRYGHSADSAVGYGHFAVWLGNDWGQRGRVMGDLAPISLGRWALEIVEHLPCPTVRGQILWLNGAYLHHWREHSRDVVTTLQAAYQACLDVGDMATATAALTTSYSHRYYLGLTAVGELQKMLTGGEGSASLALYRASWEVLAQRLDNHPTLPHETHLYDTLVARATGQVASPGDDYGRFEFALNKLVLSYWFDDPLAARIHGQTARQYRDSARGTLGYGLWCFYDALTCFALLKPDAPPHLQTLWQRINDHERRLSRWAKLGPIPYGHRLCLVQAERSRHLGQLTAAIRLYDEAIALATEQGYLSELALAYELAARFYLSHGKTLVAKAYLQEARYTYQKWGAMAKVHHIDSSYPTLFIHTPPPATPSPTTTTHHIDLATVIQASQALSREIRLDRLLARLIEMLLTNTGAERGYLLSEVEGQWLIEMEGEADSPTETLCEQVQLLQHRSPAGHLPLSLLVYVVRTLTTVVVDDASQAIHDPASPLYQNHDDYILNHQPRSLLCAPLFHQGKLLNIVYLENNLATGVFSAARLELVQLLCAQAGISLENARLYAAQEQYTYTLEQRVAERTAELAQANAELQRLATSDGLTHLANRRRFDQYLEQVWQRAAREKAMIGLILCDVDFFKQYNDYYGHQMGDDCLVAIARALEQSVQRPADLVARYGGEEFAVILPDTTASGSITVAQRIGVEVTALQIPHAMSDVSPWVSVSLGVMSWLPSPQESPRAFLLAADRALYSAKHQGRNRWVMA